MTCSLYLYLSVIKITPLLGLVSAFFHICIYLFGRYHTQLTAVAALVPDSLEERLPCSTRFVFVFLQITLQFVDGGEYFIQFPAVLLSISYIPQGRSKITSADRKYSFAIASDLIGKRALNLPLSSTAAHICLPHVEQIYCRWFRRQSSGFSNGVILPYTE